MMTNLTPHSVMVYDGGTLLYTLPKDHGFVARCDEQKIPDESPGIFIVRYGAPYLTGPGGEHLPFPEEEEGVYLVVSAMVRTSLPHRRDVLSPLELVTDEGGRVIGCRAFARNAP